MEFLDIPLKYVIEVILWASVLKIKDTAQVFSNGTENMKYGAAENEAIFHKNTVIGKVYPSLDHWFIPIL